MQSVKKIQCPCGSRKTYSTCCQIFHDGTPAHHALQLMRSRYCAYALGKVDYIIRTTHPANSNFNTNFAKWGEEILFFCQNTLFQKLEIIEFIEDVPFSFVSFIAHMNQNNHPVKLIEKSRFEKIEKDWLYLDGVFMNPSLTPKP